THYAVSERTVRSAFTELLIPIVGDANLLPLIRTLELSIAGRYDDYSDFGSAANPKVGIAWAPITGLTVRGTYAKSFRAPTLDQLTPLPLYYTLAAVDAQSPSGFTDTLVNQGQGQSSLRAERAKSFTFGIDVKPPTRPGLAVSASYFHVSY